LTLLLLHLYWQSQNQTDLPLHPQLLLNLEFHPYKFLHLHHHL
jgi:hypothetical protein